MTVLQRWILDDGPLDVLARHAELIDRERWPKGTFLVADTTAAAAADDHRRRALLQEKDAGLVSVFSIAPKGEAADIVHRHLRDRGTSPTANLAEHQCIAYALTAAPNAIFVTQDKRAAFLALYELGPGRVVHSMDLWRHLERDKLVDTEGFTRLVNYTVHADQSLPGAPWRFRS